MPINHKFLQENWNNGFQTHNAILDVTPGYEPEVLFIGTFNPNLPWNPAEFFYRRNYFWPIFGNLANNNPNHFDGNIEPNLDHVWEYCLQFKLTFADIVRGTNQNTRTVVNQEDESVSVTNTNINAPYEWNSFSDAQLNYLGRNNCLNDNICEIVSFIRLRRSVKHIYFTWKLDNYWLSTLANQIVNTEYDREVSFECILSPSGNGFGKLIPGYPSKMKSIMHAWLWVNDPGFVPAYRRVGFSHLDRDWLVGAGVDSILF